MRSVLVTGAASGIGEGLASGLARAGLHVAVTDLERHDTGSVVARIRAEGGSAEAVALDVTSDDSVAAALGALSRSPDVIINNAGLQHVAPLEEFPIAKWEYLVQVMLVGSARLTRAVLPGMRQRGFGRIINIGSTAGLKGYPYVAAYVAAKHAVIGFTRALALEHAKSGITVNALCPGYTDTDLVRQSIETVRAKTGSSAEAVLGQLTAANPQGRLVRPQEVAAAALWLASDEAAGVTGQAIAIDGGESVA